MKKDIQEVIDDLTEVGNRLAAAHDHYSASKISEVQWRLEIKAQVDNDPVLALARFIEDVAHNEVIHFRGEHQDIDPEILREQIKLAVSDATDNLLVRIDRENS
jgi:hypothetical protein